MIPVPQRERGGKPAACELQCLAKVIEILPLDRIPQRMEELGGSKVTCFMP